MNIPSSCRPPALCFLKPLFNFLDPALTICLTSPHSFPSSHLQLSPFITVSSQPPPYTFPPLQSATTLPQLTLALSTILFPSTYPLSLTSSPFHAWCACLWKIFLLALLVALSYPCPTMPLSQLTKDLFPLPSLCPDYRRDTSWKSCQESEQVCVLGVCVMLYTCVYLHLDLFCPHV